MRTFTGNTRKEELDKLTAGYNRLLYLTVLMVALAVAALIAALAKAMFLSVIFLLLMFLVRVTLYGKARADYRQAITEAALACSVGARLDEFELKRKGGTGITPEDVLSAELFPVRDNDKSAISFFQGISGTTRGMGVSLNDTTLPQYQHAGRKGAAVACGVWMRFLLPKDSGLDLRIVSGELLSDDLRKEFFESLPGLTEQAPDDTGLDGSLCLYDRDSSYRSLPPSFVPAVNSLSKKCAGDLALSVRGDAMDLFVKGRILSPNYNLKKKPDEKLLQFDPVPEFKDALNLAGKL